MIQSHFLLYCIMIAKFDIEIQDSGISGKRY